MNSRPGLLLLLLALAGAGLGRAEAPRIVVRIDDLGMAHAVNQAARQVVEAGFPVSASVMFGTPWYQEAIEILKGRPHVAVGAHLMVNSEWKNYRWGPVAGASIVPSLVDENGFFWPNHAAFDSHPIKLAEVEKELRAQLDRAMRCGVKIDYMDTHMGTIVGTLELRELYERLAKEYKLAMPRYFGEIYNTLFAVAPGEKTRGITAVVDGSKDGSLNLIVVHTGLDTPEMNALVDSDNPLMSGPKGESLVRLHRHAELKALLSKDFQRAVKRRGARLMNYRELSSEAGLDSMRRPELK